MAKIIFLDIDGVLNYVPMVSHKMPKSDTCGDEYPFSRLSKSRIAELNKLTSETGAKIVISSSWRRVSREVAKILTSSGVTGEFIGETPREKVYGDIRVFRGNEIYTWMTDNKELIGCHPADFHSYVILDDSSDMLLCQTSNFIHTDRHVGLSVQAAYQAKRILMRGAHVSS